MKKQLAQQLRLAKYIANQERDLMDAANVIHSIIMSEGAGWLNDFEVELKTRLKVANENLPQNDNNEPPLEVLKCPAVRASLIARFTLVGFMAATCKYYDRILTTLAESEEGADE